MMSSTMGISTRTLIPLTVLLFIFTFVVYAGADNENGKLKVKVYYEALCSDSIRFIRNQLLPSMTKKNRYNFTELEFVPYGHVVSWTNPDNNEKVMQCQHGHKECVLNAQHACVLENNSARESFDLITCMMSSFNKDLDMCAKRFEINTDAAKKCQSSRSIPDILGKYGVDTNSINPSFVPAISLEGTYSWDDQDDILKDFDAVFCGKYKDKFAVELPDCNVRARSDYGLFQF